MSWLLHPACCSTAELDKNELYCLALDTALTCKDPVRLRMKSLVKDEVIFKIAIIGS